MRKSLASIVHVVVVPSTILYCATALAVINPGISVEIADIVQMPNTRTNTPEDARVSPELARINFLKEIPDDSGRWFVNDLRGQVYIVDSATHQVQPDLFLDFETEFTRFIIGPGGLSTGLINITPHPNFGTNGKFYSIHEESVASRGPTADFVAQGNPGNIASGQHTVITEWSAANPSANVFAGSRREIMRIAQPAGNLHPAGDIFFHPNDGLMYIAIGDSGYDSEGKGSDQAQRLDSIHGKIIRIDPAGNNSANGKYGIPAGNPFADGAGGNLDELFSVGFRNPHRLMWDPVTELLFTTDIGQGFAEEINIVRAGGNYGWDLYEGTFTRGGGNLASPPAGITIPIAQYLHIDLPVQFDAIAGGFVYRGAILPELYGKFVYGDIVSGQLLYSDMADILAADAASDLSTAPVYSLSLTRDGLPITLKELIIDARGLGETTLPNFDRHDLRFGQTSDGEIYIITKADGFIRRLGVVPEPSGLALIGLALVLCGGRNPTGFNER